MQSFLWFFMCSKFMVEIWWFWFYALFLLLDNLHIVFLMLLRVCLKELWWYLDIRHTFAERAKSSTKYSKLRKVMLPKRIRSKVKAFTRVKHVVAEVSLFPRGQQILEVVDTWVCSEGPVSQAKGHKKHMFGTILEGSGKLLALLLSLTCSTYKSDIFHL